MTTPASYDIVDDVAVQEVIERKAQRLSVERNPIAADEIVDRLIFALVNEGLRILDEGIAQRPGDIDEFRQQYGEANWAPAPLLEKLVRDGRSIADWAAERNGPK